MGKKTNNLIYLIIIILIFAILVIKLLFSRKLPISYNKQIKTLISKENNNLSSLNKKRINPKKIKLSRSKKVSEIKMSGKHYIFTGKNSESGLELKNLNNGSFAIFTKYFLVTLNNNYSISDVLKKYNLKLIKHFKHLNRYYVQSASASFLKQMKEEISKEPSIQILNFEIIQRNPKTK